MVGVRRDGRRSATTATMPTPPGTRAVADTTGERIEVADGSGGAFDLAGVTLTVGTRTCELSGRAPSLLGIVTGRSDDPHLNGGVPVWTVCGFSLVNSGFTATLRA